MVVRELPYWARTDLPYWARTRHIGHNYFPDRLWSHPSPYPRWLFVRPECITLSLPMVGFGGPLRHPLKAYQIMPCMVDTPVDASEPRGQNGGHKEDAIASILCAIASSPRVTAASVAVTDEPDEQSHEEHSDNPPPGQEDDEATSLTLNHTRLNPYTQDWEEPTRPTGRAKLTAPDSKSGLKAVRAGRTRTERKAAAAGMRISSIGKRKVEHRVCLRSVIGVSFLDWWSLFVHEPYGTSVLAWSHGSECSSPYVGGRGVGCGAMWKC